MGNPVHVITQTQTDDSVVPVEATLVVPEPRTPLGLAMRGLHSSNQPALTTGAIRVKAHQRKEPKAKRHKKQQKTKIPTQQELDDRKMAATLHVQELFALKKAFSIQGEMTNENVNTIDAKVEVAADISANEVKDRKRATAPVDVTADNGVHETDRDY